MGVLGNLLTDGSSDVFSGAQFALSPSVHASGSSASQSSFLYTEPETYMIISSDRPVLVNRRVKENLLTAVAGSICAATLAGFGLMLSAFVRARRNAAENDFADGESKLAKGKGKGRR